PRESRSGRAAAWRPWRRGGTRRSATAARRRGCPCPAGRSRPAVRSGSAGPTAGRPPPPWWQRSARRSQAAGAVGASSRVGPPAAVPSFPIFTDAYRSVTRAAPKAYTLEHVGGEVGEPRALPAHQRDVPGVGPAAEAVDGVGESGGHLREVRGVDLRDVAEAGELGAGPGARDQRLHLLGREVLRLVQDQEAVEEGAAAHEVERADLDAVAQQVIGRGTTPVAALLRAGEHLEVVHERTHPRLHLFLLGTGQEADVLAERDGHARHDDLDEAVGLERLHQAA